MQESTRNSGSSAGEEGQSQPAQERVRSATSAYRLYSEYSSPFSAPVRAAIYHKELDIDIAPPPGGLYSAAYHAVNPTGTIPCLVRDDGFVLPESAAILEFLEEEFPARPLLPRSNDARSRVRLLHRIGELGIMTQTVELSRLSAAASKGDVAVSFHLTRLVRSLAALEVFLEGPRYAVGTSLSIADCQLAPAIFRVPIVSGTLRLSNLLTAYPKVDQYSRAVMREPAIRRVLLELQGEPHAPEKETSNAPSSPQA